MWSIKRANSYAKTSSNEIHYINEAVLEPKQFKNNLIMFEDKPQFEFCRLLAGSNFEVDAQKNQNDV